MRSSSWLACDIDAIKNVVGSRDIKIIEDCAQAHGALYKGRPVGSLGDIAAWSFCQDKIMSTGGEGMAWMIIWFGIKSGVIEITEKAIRCIQLRGKRFSGCTRFDSNFRLTEMKSLLAGYNYKICPYGWKAATGMRNANKRF